MAAPDGPGDAGPRHLHAQVTRHIGTQLLLVLKTDTKNIVTFAMTTRCTIKKITDLDFVTLFIGSCNSLPVLNYTIGQ